MHGLLRSKVRFSTLRGLLFVHSAFPTIDRDAVFFGPNTYRFTRFIEQVLRQIDLPANVDPIVDMGCGSGAGGIIARTLLPHAGEVVLADINTRALHHAWVNATLDAGAQARLDRYIGRKDPAARRSPACGRGAVVGECQRLAGGGES